MNTPAQMPRKLPAKEPRMNHQIETLTARVVTLEAHLETLKMLVHKHIDDTDDRFDAVADWMEAEDE